MTSPLGRATVAVGAPLAGEGAPGTGEAVLLGPWSVSSSPSWCRRLSRWLTGVLMRFPAVASAHGATSPSTIAARCTGRRARGAHCLAIRGAWAGPLTRPTRRAANMLMPFLVTRWAEPARTPPGHWRPRCGRLEEVRRLAGPGLGNAAAVRTTAKTAGRSPLRWAALLSTTAGGSGE